MVHYEITKFYVEPQ